LHETKREWLKDLIENAIAPTLLIYEFQEDFQMLRELLGDDLPYLGAGISDKRADANIKAWNAGKLPFMGLHPASGGHGLNLQHGGADMAWISPTWNPELWDQTLARLHRSGQPRQVVVRVCVATGTIDEVKLDRVHHKLSAQQAFERYLQRVRVVV
jgi:SNF2 family DNA or RNA helicase